MRLEDLDYQLPEELIAQHPSERREDARLLVVDRATSHLTDTRISELGQWLRPGDILALNETRVRPARLMLHRSSGGKVEMLFVRPEEAGATSERWRVLAKPARHASLGALLATADDTLALEVVDEGEQGERVVRIVRGALHETLQSQGGIPLPPYIRRAPGAEDRERYQTVFSRVEGAVAAPTAGLHFTRDLLSALEAMGVSSAPLLLHVGPGTFRPITTADPHAHRMDEEWFELSAAAAEKLAAARAKGGRIIAVGTTAVRTLESACDANGGRLGAASGWTRKFILPPYHFQAADALLTNFHLPRTTLLLLVAALAGSELLQNAYSHAVRERYRFYSYGDAMLVV
ncbi:MAG: tRNA preQ1(34) S-adenosylmethionine ribosyltransferase-isomerase QueA [Candidatus Eisenbacteria bacterium]